MARLKSTALLLFISLLSTSLQAQTLTQTVRGTIIDKESKVPLIGANVLILNLNPPKGVSTDMDGNFRLEEVPIGRYDFKVSYLGYEDIFMKEVLVGSGKEVVLQIGMIESVAQLQEAKVTARKNQLIAKNEMATVSARSFKVEETKRFAAAFNDPSRMAISYAGVSSASDGNNDIVIRGNSPRGLLWRMEGVEIPNPNHFGDEGASGGGISMLSVNMIDNSDFYTGAFPAEYGNALSGVFDINLRKGNNQKREYAFQASVLGTDIALEGPFSSKSKASYLVNYRYSTLDILSGLGILSFDGGAIPVFQDLSWKIHVPTKAGTFSFWGLAGTSESSSDAPRDTSEWEEDDYAYDEVFISEMAVAGLDHLYTFKNKKTYLKTVVSGSMSRNFFTFDTLSYEFIPFRDDDAENKSEALRFSSLINHKFNAKNTLRAGVIHSLLGFDLRTSGYDYDDQVYKTYLNNSGNTSLTQAYAQWKFRPTQRLSVTSGLHTTHFSLNGATLVEPRMGARYRVAGGQTITAGIGVHNRVESMSTYFYQEQQADGSITFPNKGLRPSQAAHYVLGYDRRFGEHWSLRVETYYQHLFNVPIENNDSSQFSALNATDGFATSPLENEGTGSNYGVEITLQKALHNHYYLLFTTSLFESKYKAGDGQTYNTRYNGNYIVNMVGGKEFIVGRDKNKRLSFNTRLLAAGGKRYTPIDLEASRAQGETVRITEQTFSKRTKDYFRADVGVKYRKDKPRASYIVALDVQNVSNRENEFSRYYDADTGQERISRQIGLLPVLSYRIEF